MGNIGKRVSFTKPKRYKVSRPFYQTRWIEKLKCHAACLDPLPAPVAWRHCSGVWHHVLSCHRVGMLSQSFMIFRHYLRKARHDKAYKTFFYSMCSRKIGRDHPVQARLNCTVWGTSWLYAPIKHLSDELASHLPLVSSSTGAQSLGNKGGTWSIDSAAIKRQQCAKSVSASWQRMVMIASLTVPRYRVHCHQTDVPNKASWMKFQNTSKSYTITDPYPYMLYQFELASQSPLSRFLLHRFISLITH